MSVIALTGWFIYARGGGPRIPRGLIGEHTVSPGSTRQCWPFLRPLSAPIQVRHLPAGDAELLPASSEGYPLHGSSSRYFAVQPPELIAQGLMHLDLAGVLPDQGND